MKKTLKKILPLGLILLFKASCFAADDKVYSLGEPVTFDDSQWVVLSAVNLGHVLRGPSVEDVSLVEPKKSEGVFIKVKFKIKNTGSSEESILNTPKLKDTEGNEYEEMDDIAMYLAEGEDAMTLAQLPAHISKTFISIYEVPSEVKGLNFMTRSLAPLFTDYKPVSLNQRVAPTAPAPTAQQPAVSAVNVQALQQQLASLQQQLAAKSAQPNATQGVPSAQDVAAADIQLSTVYHQLMSNLPVQMKSELKKAEIAWIKEKDAFIAANPNNPNGAALQAINKRTQFLQQKLRN